MKGFLILIMLFFLSCSSSVTLYSNLTHDDIVYNKKQQPIGRLPYKHTDKKPSFCSTTFYVNGLKVKVRRNKTVVPAAIIGGFCTGGIGFAWVLGYPRLIDTEEIGVFEPKKK